MRLFLLSLTLLALVGCRQEAPASGRHSDDTSALWGREGELWSASGRLPDFSHAGWDGGGKPLPELPVSVNVRDFGALGDGETDDSEAFAAALAAASNGAVWIPAGRYRLSRVLRLDRSGVVLRGAGPEKTVLFFPQPLFEILGPGGFGGPYGWAWGGGWVWARGTFEETLAAAEVIETAERGDRALELSSTSAIQPGQLVRLIQSESEGSLTLHLHNEQPLNGRCWIDKPGFRAIDWVFRVERVQGNRVLLDRPLRVDVRPEWLPKILAFRPTVHDIGVEDLKVEFPLTEYNGHHNEPGYNAIYFHGVHNAWVRNVVIENFDTAVSFWHSRYSTARGVTLRGRGGHYGLNLGASQDCWMTDFAIENISLHDLSVSNLANGNVFSNGKGVDINFDHHRGAAYENLFSNIDVGTSWRRYRLWDSSGTPSGHYTAARETFWNIRPRLSTKWIPAWPQANLVGPVRKKEAVELPLDDLWIEPIRGLKPADLHAAQLALRMASSSSSTGRP